MGIETDFRGTPRFEVLSRLGAGSSGVVYQALDRQHNREVALKALRARDALSIKRFQAEFSSCQGLTHPSLVRFEEMFEDDGQWFFTMELVRGVDMLSYLRPTPLKGAAGFDQARGRSVLRQLAESLAALHRTGRVHRDVKPANVRVTAEGRAVLLDLGLSTEILALASEAEGVLVGTPIYCAPEQVLGEEPGPAADWYSFGVVLFEALLGRPVFEGSVQQVLEAKVAGEPDLHDLTLHGESDLAELCGRLLLREPSRRPDGLEVLTTLGAQGLRSGEREATLLTQQNELATLKIAFARARQQLQHVCVVGSAGVGKSTLLATFGEWAASEHALVLHSRCYREIGLPFEPLQGVARLVGDAWLQLESQDAAQLRREVEPPFDPGPLGLLLPALSMIESVAEAAHSAGPGSLVAQRTRGFVALRKLLHDIARARPLVWLIDDRDLIDQDSARALEVLLQGEGAPRLLLVTSQSSAYEPPGFGQQELIALEAANAAQTIDERWRALAPDAQALVRALCVAGHSVPRELLSEVTALRGGPFAQTLSKAQAAGLVREVTVGEARGLEAVHRWLAEDQAEPERVQLSARWAIAMHAMHGMPEATLARHGGLDPQCREAARKHALQAGQQLAFALEARMLALELQAHTPSDAEAQRANLEIGEAWLRAGNPAEGARKFLAAAAFAKGSDALSLRRRSAELLMQAGQIDESVIVLDELLKAVDVKPMSTAGWSLASLAWHRSVLSIRGHGYEPRSAGQLIPRGLAEVDVMWSVGQIASIAKTLQGLDVQTRGLRRALTLGEPYRVARALATEATSLAGSEAPPQLKAQVALLTARKLVKEMGDPGLDAACDVADAAARFFSADMRGAFTLAMSAEGKLRALPHPPTVEIAYAQGFCLFSSNSFAGAGDGMALYERFVDEARARGDTFAEAMLTTGARAYLATMTGDAERVIREIEGALSAWRETEIHFLHVYKLLSLAHLDLYKYDGNVLKRMDLLWPQLARGGLLRLRPLRPFLARVRGAAFLATATERGHKATAAAVRKEAAAARATKHAGGQGMAHILEAGAHLLLGREDLAVADLERANSVLEPTGMDNWRQAARYQLGRLRGGDEGRVLRASAEADMRSRGIIDPLRFADTYATGCGK